jgi:hypothetical protein
MRSTIQSLALLTLSVSFVPFGTVGADETTIGADEISVVHSSGSQFMACEGAVNTAIAACQWKKRPIIATGCRSCSKKDDLFECEGWATCKRP